MNKLYSKRNLKLYIMYYSVMYVAVMQYKINTFNIL